MTATYGSEFYLLITIVGIMKIAEEIHSSSSDRSSESLDSIQIITENGCKIETESKDIIFQPLQPFSYKVKDIKENWVHSFMHYPVEGIKKMHEIIDTSLLHSPLMSTKYGMNYMISYWDSAGDLISLYTDNDIYECVISHQRKKKERASLIIHSVEERQELIQKSKKETLITISVLVALFVLAILGNFLKNSTGKCRLCNETI